jgi:hypothetical protein
MTDPNKTDPNKSEASEAPKACKRCFRTGHHGPVFIQGPPWAPYAWTEAPCPNG